MLLQLQAVSISTVYLRLSYLKNVLTYFIEVFVKWSQLANEKMIPFWWWSGFWRIIDL